MGINNGSINNEAHEELPITLELKAEISKVVVDIDTLKSLFINHISVILKCEGAAYWKEDGNVFESKSQNLLL